MEWKCWYFYNINFAPRPVLQSCKKFQGNRNIPQYGTFNKVIILLNSKFDAGFSAAEVMFFTFVQSNYVQLRKRSKKKRKREVNIASGHIKKKKTFLLLFIIYKYRFSLLTPNNCKIHLWENMTLPSAPCCSSCIVNLFSSHCSKHRMKQYLSVSSDSPSFAHCA